MNDPQLCGGRYTPTKEHAENGSIGMWEVQQYPVAEMAVPECNASETTS